MLIRTGGRGTGALWRRAYASAARAADAFDDVSDALPRVRTPREIKDEFDRYVCAQENAKRVLSVACYNHMLRIGALDRARQRQYDKELRRRGMYDAYLAQMNADQRAVDDEETGAEEEMYTPVGKRSDKAIEKEFEYNLRRHAPSHMAQSASGGTAPFERPASSSASAFAGRRQHKPAVDQWSDGGKLASGVHEETRADEEEQLEDEEILLEKSNVLLLGPTGSGKTLLAKTLAKFLDVPFSMSDCTTMTQAGYVGDDVESCILRLLAASNYDVARAERGIICLDEVDKIARRTSDGSSAGRDVAGEGVQQALLKILEGTTVTVTDRHGPSHVGRNDERPRTGYGLPKGMNGSLGGSSLGHGPGGGHSSPGGNGVGSSGPNSSGAGNHAQTYTVDTSNILFILTGAFTGLERIILDRASKGSIGFGARLRNSAAESEKLLEENWDLGVSARNMRQRFAEGVQERRDHHDQSKVLAFAQPEDLVKFGFLPEFIGRVPQITSMHELSTQDLVRVITEPRNALEKQYRQLFRLSGVSLDFTRAALHTVAEQSRKSRLGARGLRRILDACLHEANFDAPGRGIRALVVTRAVVLGQARPFYFSRSQMSERDRVIAEENAVFDREQAGIHTDAEPLQQSRVADRSTDSRCASAAAN